MSQEPDEITAKGSLPLSQEEDELNESLLPLPNAGKWEKIHQIFYQGKNYYRVIDVIDALPVRGLKLEIGS